MKFSYQFLKEYEHVFWNGVFVLGKNDCWPWLKSTDKDGYGRVCFGRSREEKAHRMILALHLGRELDEDKQALHHCDNAGCCNPEHLYEGTQLNNVHDCWNRDRHDQSGDLNNASKLTLEQVRLIKASDLQHSVLAKQFKVSRSLIGLIKNGHRWSHLCAS
jgi:hypothetical protein